MSNPNPDNKVQEAKDLVAQAKANPTMNPSIYYCIAPYIYVSHMEFLVKPNWLVEVFNKHLNLDDWPSYDNTVTNDLTLGTDLEQSQVKLEDQVSSTNLK